MKRFLFLFTLVAFSVLSCAGSIKAGRGTKSDFNKDQFDKDREECIQSIQKEASEQETTKIWGQADIEECLARKANTVEPPSEDKDRKKPLTVGKVLEISAAVVLALGIVTLRVLAGGI